MAQRRIAVIGSALVAWLVLPPPTLADEGTWVNVSELLDVDDPIPANYDPCARQPPHTLTQIRMVDGVTRDDENEVSMTNRYDPGAQEIWEFLASVERGGEVVSRDVADAYSDDPTNPRAYQAYRAAAYSGFREQNDDFFSFYEPKEQKYEVYCLLPAGYAEPDDENGEAGEPPEPEILYEEFWVPLITEPIIEAELLLMISQYLAPPETDFLITSPQGWLFAKVPTEIIVDNVGSVTLYASVTNRTGSVTASITATPTQLSFDADERIENNSRGMAVCDWGDVQAQTCMYEYYNASSIEPDHTFETTSVLAWQVETSSHGMFTLYTGSSQPVQVAEFQTFTTG